MENTPQVPQSGPAVPPPLAGEQNPAQPAGNSASKKSKRKRLHIIIAAVVAFLAFCYIVDLCDEDDSRTRSRNSYAGGGSVYSVNRSVSGSSSRRALHQTLSELNNTYGGSVQILGAIGSSDDKQAEAVFSLQKDYCRQLGFARATAGGNNQCDVYIKIAPRQQVADIFQTNRTVQSNSNNAAPQPQPLTSHRLPDGSGTIKLPANWVINEANQGSVVASGGGDIVEFCGRCPMFTQASVGGAPPNMAPWGPAKDIFPTATQAYWNFLQHAGGPARRFVQLVETQMFQGQPNSQTMLAVYDWNMNGQSYRSLGLFIAMPTSNVSWLYYISSVSAPQAQFKRDLPTMLEIWKSWRVDPGVTRARLMDAANKLRSCTDIILEANANRQRTFDRTNEDWTEYFRGQTFLRDDLTEQTNEVPDDRLQQMVDGWNHHEGYERFKIIPRRDLFP